MKISIGLTAIIVCLLLAQCAQQKRIEYVIPDEYTGQTRTNMENMLIAGQKLFKIHCSQCHGIFTKGKDSIPNFSKTQIEAYKASALLDDPKNHAVAQKVRPDDLDLILQFLSFRKTKPE
jgi:mono/diheme cytochrome c family protein